ncbi:hypothetical protein BD626DRAFT_633957 [Schizophyllum amplum]|uniref:Uncharacterized protein n=1 Tax=Schizophyllum amplum TaxID=97359 RepID=A0A550C0Y2_9AGAR|nr:hypothetical protein BD626DRAFT_633957 [Auriculariopsis ampla]
MATFRKTDDLSHISLALHPYLVRAHPASSTHDDLPEMSSVTIDALMSSSWVIALPVTVTLQHPLNFFRSADGTVFRISQQTHDVIKSLSYANSSRAISLYCDHPDSAQRDKEEVYPGTAAVPREEVDTTPSAPSGSTLSPIPTSFTFNPDAAPFKPRLAPASSLPNEEVVSPTTTPLWVEETLAQVASPASVTEEDPAQTSAPQTPVKLRPSATTITSSTSAPEAEKENGSLTVAADSPAQRFRRRGMRQASKRGAPTDETRPNKRQCTPSGLRLRVMSRCTAAGQQCHPAVSIFRMILYRTKNVTLSTS